MQTKTFIEYIYINVARKNVNFVHRYSKTVIFLLTDTLLYIYNLS